MGFIVVLTTAATREEAEMIARSLLEARLVACVNIVDSVSSFFWWQGRIDSAKEVLLLMKTHERLFSKLEEKLRSIHSYQVPEIIGLPISAVSKPYLEWLMETFRPGE